MRTCIECEHRKSCARYWGEAGFVHIAICPRLPHTGCRLLMLILMVVQIDIGRNGMSNDALRHEWTDGWTSSSLVLYRERMVLVFCIHTHTTSTLTHTHPPTSKAGCHRRNRTANVEAHMHVWTPSSFRLKWILREDEHLEWISFATSVKIVAASHVYFALCVCDRCCCYIHRCLNFICFRWTMSWQRSSA